MIARRISLHALNFVIAFLLLEYSAVATGSQTLSSKINEGPARIIKPTLPSREYAIDKVEQNRLNTLLDQVMSTYQTPGIWAAEAQNGKIIAISCRGYSCIDSAKLAAKEQMIPIGSGSKAIFGFCTALEIYRKKWKLPNGASLGWKTSFGDVVDWSQNPNFYKVKDTTIEQLFSHISGLGGGRNEDRLTEKDPVACRELFDQQITLEHPLVGKPGEKLEYTGGAQLVGHELERLSGLSAERLLSEDLFQPWGAPSCRLGEPGYYPGDNSSPDVPFGYDYDASGATKLFRGGEKRTYPHLSYSIAGACYGRVDDWAILLSRIAMVKNNPEAFGLGKDFYPNAFAKPSPVTFFTRCGFEQIGEDLFYHGGGVDRGQAAIYTDMKSGKSLCVFFNRIGGVDNNPYYKLIDSMRYPIFGR